MTTPETTSSFPLKELTPTARQSRFRGVRSMLLAAVLCGGAAHGQGYPNKPIRIVVPFSPGAAVAGPTRVFAQELGKRLKQQVNVENKPGAGATIGSGEVAKAAPDGIAGFDDLLQFFKLLPHPDKQFTVLNGISHASFQQNNYKMVHQILHAYFTQPEPAHTDYTSKH